MSDNPTNVLAQAKDPARTASGFVARPVSTVHASVNRFLCRMLFLPLYYLCVGAMRHLGGWRIDNIDEIRALYKELAQSDEPMIVCANHLTFIDSALMHWGFGTGHWYFSNFDKFSWNLPAGDFFKKKLFHRFMGAISKCLFIHRDGSKEHKDSVSRMCTQLVKNGEVVTLFPEGKRSRTGRFDPDKLTYGIGRMVMDLGGSCRILCAYVRAEGQENYSNYPPKGAKIHFQAELIQARSSLQGRDAYQEIVAHVGRTIKTMEDRYFESRS